MEKKVRKVDIVKLIGEFEELFKIHGDPAWLEGWICGYTDADHGIENNYELRDLLSVYLNYLYTQTI